jgi:hypothetical protein
VIFDGRCCKVYSGIESNGLLFMLSLLGSQRAMGECSVAS